MLSAAAAAWAGCPNCCYGPSPQCPNFYPWHGYYSYTPWGRPAALVVPPTAEYQTHWGWGVGNTQISRLWNQFQPDYPGVDMSNPQGFRTTPRWPSSTDQFGVYYIRGPW